MPFSDTAVVAYYDNALKGTALGRKMRQHELNEELAQEYRNGEF